MLLKVYIISTFVILYLTYKVFETGMVSSNICIFLGTIAIIPVFNTLLIIGLLINMFKENSFNINMSEYSDILEEYDKYGEKIKKFLGL